jgi:hypothetical protein
MANTYVLHETAPSMYYMTGAYDRQQYDEEIRKEEDKTMCKVCPLVVVCCPCLATLKVVGMIRECIKPKVSPAAQK